jgi:hypothetical protein
MKWWRWCYPDGFVGDDPSSQRNARWLAVFVMMYLLLAGSTYAGGAFPPLSFLAGQLGVSRGQQLPKGVIWNGRPYTFVIVGASEHPGGRYTVEIQAR